jgi:repressor LexA
MMTSAGPPRRGGHHVLTHRRRRIVQAIEQYLREHGRPPTNREIADLAGLAGVSSVSYQLRALRAAGIVTYEDGCPRTVRVLRPIPPPGVTGEASGPAGPAADGVPGEAGQGRVVWAPVAGRIAAGGPITAEQSIEGYLPLPKEVVGSDEGLFVLEVTGDSMIGVGIFSGDWVVLRQLFQPPQNGDIVAATINGAEVEGTVKTYKKIGRQVWLMPHNPAYTPIPGGKAKFAGRVVAVLRRV